MIQLLCQPNLSRHPALRRHGWLLPTLMAAMVTSGGGLGGSAVAAENVADPIVRLEAAAWYASPSLEATAKGSAAVNENDLGIDSATGVIAEAIIDVPVPLIPGIHLGGWNWNGEGKAEVGTLKVTGGHALALWEFELLDRVAVAVGGGAAYQKLDNTEASDDQILPALAVRGWVKLTGDLAVEARVLAAKGSNDRQVTDAAGQISWRCLGPVSVIGGYKYVNTQLPVADVDWDVILSGPFAGAAVSF
jgi:hypothetical protein